MHLPIAFPIVRMKKSELRPSESGPVTVMHMHAAVDQQVAKDMGIFPLVYSPDGIQKPGYRAITLDDGLFERFRMRFVIPGLEQFALEIDGDCAECFRLISDDSRLGVTFKVWSRSSPHDIADWTIRHGEAAGTMRMDAVGPVQAEFSLEDETESAEGEASAGAQAVQEAAVSGADPYVPPVNAPPTRENIDAFIRTLDASIPPGERNREN